MDVNYAIDNDYVVVEVEANAVENGEEDAHVIMSKVLRNNVVADYAIQVLKIAVRVTGDVDGADYEPFEHCKIP